MRISATLVYSIYIAVLLFCWLTMGTSYAADGDSITSYGFPIAWYTPVVATSGGHQIAIGRLMVDFATYFVLIYLLLLALRNVITVPSMLRRALKILSPIAAAASLFFSIVVFATSPHFAWWDFPASAQIGQQATHFVSVGLQPQPAEHFSK